MTPENKKILFIEDDADMAKLLQQRAKKFSFDSEVDGKGVDCVEVAEKYKPNVIILDLNFPKTTGYDLLMVLKRHPTLKNIPVVVLSVFHDKEIIRGAMELGARAYFVKGKNLDQLFQKIESIL